MSENYSDPIENINSDTSFMANIKKKFMAYWSKLTHTQKRFVTIGTVLGVLVMFCVIGYSIKETQRNDQPERRRRPAPISEIDLDSKSIKKAQQDQTFAAMEKMRKEFQESMASIKKEAANEAAKKILEQEKNTAAPKADLDTGKPPVNCDVGKASAKPNTGMTIPPPPNPGKSPKSMFANEPPQPEIAAKPAYKKLGGIHLIKGSVKSDTAKKDEGKKKALKAYLSPSFMEAVTLSGMAAPTTSAGKNNPLPIFLRIKAPAFLPNEVRSQLTGCFLVGEGIGDLASERVHVRIKTLSCVSKNNSAVVDQPVKGFLTDADGRVGLRGKVTAKMGLHAARAAFASFIEAAGEAFGTSAQTISYSATGSPIQSLTDTDIGSIMTTGIGAGVAEGAKQMKQLYVQLMEQTLPVIEVGSMKRCTVVISEGVELEIKETVIF